MPNTPPSSMLPRKRRSQPPSRRVTRSAAFLLVFLLVAIALLCGVGLTSELLAPVTSDRHAKVVLVTIPPGATAKEIGRILARKHLVRFARGFEIAVKLQGLSGKLQSGRYELSPAMPPRQIAALIALGQTATDVVTVPEGFTAEQIARRLGDRGMANESTFLALVRTEGRTFHLSGWQPPGVNLEGYLFPDTYRIPKGTTEREIIQQMLADFHREIVTPYGAEIARYPGGLPALITLASLVEREARVDSDRPLVAAVLTNRLKRGMRLECDATVEYALPEHKARLLYSDLRLDSPYNTYLHPGLPPTPIASPGLPSIEAALHPAQVDYLYYVARPDGTHVFSSTLAAHNHAVAQLRARRGRA